MDRPAAFVTLEGVEGAGKSTQIPYIRALLEASGITVHCTREPGGTELAEAIRGLLLDPGYSVGIEEELLLMFAARASHLRESIVPAIGRGEWVLCDRFTDASFAYQGGGRGVDQAVIASLEQFVQKDTRPDHCLLFDLPVEQGLARAKSRGEQDRFELEEVAFFERIRAAYLQRAAAMPDRYSVIDASKPIDEVKMQIEHVISDLVSRFAN